MGVLHSTTLLKTILFTLSLTAAACGPGLTAASAPSARPTLTSSPGHENDDLRVKSGSANDATNASANLDEPAWHNMGHYGENYLKLCEYHRDTYRVIGRPAECRWADPNDSRSGYILWVWF